MHFILGPIFWGVAVTLLGISVLLNAIFGINIPFIQISFAILLIYFGVKLLSGNSCHTTGCAYTWSHSTTFTKTKTTASHEAYQDYNIAFGDNTIDLTSIGTQQAHIRVNISFGNGTLIINPESAVTIVAKSTFGNANLPDGTSVAFGSHTYTTHPEQTENRIFVEANVTFGSLTVTAK